ncbi:MAG TPA: patatin-like phospholipase family protein, partial [Pyrinomonadaceae bacterium]
MFTQSDQAESFKTVFAAECCEVQQRRLHISGEAGPDSERPNNLTGLALSGGGIRSATFCLGVLQGLSELGLLQIFDYLSTVSGGGFVGGWWSAWLSRNREENEIFPTKERIEPQRSAKYTADSRGGKLAESAISAGSDPIHHLRLFANYLTPRRGALSMDTWRAIGFISRNLILTWAVLLPVLVATVLLGQLYFAAFATSEFPHENMLVLQDTANAHPEVQRISESFVHKPSDDQALQVRKETLKKRAWLAAWPVIILGGFTLFFAFCWMIGIQNGPRLLRLMNAVIGLMLLVLLADMFLGPEWAALVVLLGILGIIVVISIVFQLRSNAMWAIRFMINSLKEGWKTGRLGGALKRLKSDISARLNDDRRTKDLGERQWQTEVYLNTLTRWMSRSLIFLVLTAIVLAIAGFGHEAVEYVCCYSAPGGTILSSLVHYATKSLSITSVVGAIAGLIYTWGRTAPIGGGDKSDTEKPSAVSRLIFAITPPLAIAVLAVVIAWLAHSLIVFIVANHNTGIDDLTSATRLGIYFAFFLVLLELDLSEIRSRTAFVWLSALFVVNAIAVIWLFIRGELHFGSIPFWSLVLIAIAGAVLFGRAVIHFLFGNREALSVHWASYFLVGVFVYSSASLLYQLFLPVAGFTIDSKWLLRLLAVVIALAIFKPLVHRMTRSRHFTQEDGRYRLWFFLAATPLLITIVLLVIGVIAVTRHMFGASMDSPADADVFQSAAKGILRIGMVFLVLVFLQLRSRKANHRSTWLATSLLVALTMLVIITFLHDNADMKYTATPLRAVVLLTTTALTWVLTLGWIVDPNSLSIHAFYKGRLVRAYLGASNALRRGKRKEVTESVEGDDVLLSELQNCRQRAPYHLINTTLNLVGGRDLAASQRSSAMFVLSKKYCGSLRTGYRPTTDYMGGELSLGTAIAVSGAAVSPNMGSLKTTASLAMLMTLLNVRLGFWAPTPNKDSWRSSQARLWPYYVLREFLSETTDLSTYCYLTDGGHFDNTGLYSLVERGCRYIVMVDSSADPGPCFADLGNAVRRCRMDFDAEIEIDVTPLIKNKDAKKFISSDYVVGSITYSEAHLIGLGWENPTAADRTGIIVYIKPGMAEKGATLSVDVRQYGIENPVFPQQSTADQWFDEAQFESYRALGQQSVEVLMESLNVGA